MTLPSLALFACLTLVGASGILAAMRLIERRRQGGHQTDGREYELAPGDRAALAGAPSRSRPAQPSVSPGRRLTPNERGRAIGDWRLIQSDFADDPTGAVERADTLLAYIMALRGYPLPGPEAAGVDLEEPQALAFVAYCEAQAFARGSPAPAFEGTDRSEQLRQAFLRYRALFDDLVNEPQALTRPLPARSERHNGLRADAGRE